MKKKQPKPDVRRINFRITQEEAEAMELKRKSWARDSGKLTRSLPDFYKELGKLFYSHIVPVGNQNMNLDLTAPLCKKSGGRRPFCDLKMIDFGGEWYCPKHDRKELAAAKKKAKENAKK